MATENEIRNTIRTELIKFYKLKKSEFIPGKTKLQYAGDIIDEKEAIAIVETLLDGWLGIGERGRKFELELAKFLNVKGSLLTNSGSSANLIAIQTLKSENNQNRLKNGDEVIHPATTFPTSLNPIIQSGLKPVLVDTKVETVLIDEEKIEDAVTEKTKAILIPHILGNVVDMDIVNEVSEKYNLYVIEDACDALGSKFDGRFVGTIGDLGTYSFYASHHITTGEGGAITSNDEKLLSVARSLRDWGRLTWCELCNKSLDTRYQCPHRFEPLKVDGDEIEYDRRFVFTEIGFSMKPTEFQAAMGIEQLNKFPGFMNMRKGNFEKLYKEISRFDEYFILPKSPQKSEPCWFAFPLTVKQSAPFERKSIVKWLEDHQIETRLLFAGNIAKQPAYRNIDFRISGELVNANFIMKNSFFIGLYPGIDEERLNYMIRTFEEFVNKHK